jgi:hypothetical protein
LRFQNEALKQKWMDNRITEEQMLKSNEPQFIAALMLGGPMSTPKRGLRYRQTEKAN